MSRARSGLAERMLTCAVLTTALVGCRESVEISLRTALVEPSEPSAGMVGPGVTKDGSSATGGSRSGPYIVVVFSTPSDLDSLARKMRVHHVYYTLYACSSVASAADLCDGRVYLLGAEELARIQEGQAPSEHNNVYKAYISDSVLRLQGCAQVDGGLDAAQELEKVRSDGLCMTIGAGNMLGGGFSSNAIRVPVVVDRDFFLLEQEPLADQASDREPPSDEETQ